MAPPLAYAFLAVEKERVVSIIHPENRTSIRLVERLGERLHGRIEHLGREREILCFAIGRKSWLSQTAEKITAA